MTLYGICENILGKILKIANPQNFFSRGVNNNNVHVHVCISYNWCAVVYQV